MKEYTTRTTRKPSAAGGGAGPSKTLRDHLRIYFPTEQTVANSRGGRGVRNITNHIPAPSEGRRDQGHARTLEPALTRGICNLQAAGTICVQPKWWRSPAFPTALVRDCVSTPARRGILLHSKLIFVRGVDGAKPWAYVGSANLSESAW